MNIYFDMDGTLAGLFDVPDWCEKINNGISSPYADARPLHNMSQLARLLHQAQKLGYTIGIISYLSRGGTTAYNQEVSRIKRQWLHKHLPSVSWDEIHLVEYGTPKHSCGNGILFDDNRQIRAEWGEGAYRPDEIIEVLKGLIK